MENIKQTDITISKNKTISVNNSLLLQALSKHAGLLAIDCGQLLTLNSQYLIVRFYSALKRSAQRKHCINWRKY